jgi:hypothetical protein
MVTVPAEFIAAAPEYVDEGVIVTFPPLVVVIGYALAMMPPRNETFPEIEFEATAGAAISILAVLLSPPTAKPDSKSNEISDLGNSIVSAKLCPLTGLTVSVPLVLNLSGSPVLWLTNRFPTNRMSPVAEPEDVAPMLV